MEFKFPVEFLVYAVTGFQYMLSFTKLSGKLLVGSENDLFKIPFELDSNL